MSGIFCYYASNFIIVYDLLRDIMSLFIQAAHAAPETAGAAGLFGQILLPVAFFAIFYFLVIRPQSKRTKEHRAMVNALTVGSEIIFAGGLMGRIKAIEGDYAVVSLNNNTDVKVQRASVISVLPAGTIESV
jgi:preprotein translocase subunit YajC